jgi:chromatin structure-remodeling complex protein RSC7
MPVPRGGLNTASCFTADKCSNFNSTLVAQRKACWDGVYDAHTNVMHYPRITQPTHVRWERVPDDEEQPDQKLLTNGHGADDDKPRSTIFNAVPPVVARNFMVTDTVFESPALSGAGLPGVDGMALDVGANGLPSAAPEILELLPEDCREALLREKEREAEWKGQWTSEAADGMRGKLRIAFLGWPQ